MTRIGIFGGTFDPIHLGHLIVAEAAREEAGLDQIVFVPAGQPWHRGDAPAASGADRLAMVELAIAGNPAFRASSVDVDRSGPTYTVHTLERLRAALAPADLAFIIGQDALAQIGIWHDPARIADLAEILALARPGAAPFDLDSLEAFIPDARNRIRIVPAPLIDLSASDIRRRVAAGRSIRYRVQERVAEYLLARQLYRAG